VNQAYGLDACSTCSGASKCGNGCDGARYSHTSSAFDRGNELPPRLTSPRFIEDFSFVHLKHQLSFSCCYLCIDFPNHAKLACGCLRERLVSPLLLADYLTGTVQRRYRSTLRYQTVGGLMLAGGIHPTSSRPLVSSRPDSYSSGRDQQWIHDSVERKAKVLQS